MENETTEILEESVNGTKAVSELMQLLFPELRTKTIIYERPKNYYCWKS